MVFVYDSKQSPNYDDTKKHYHYSQRCDNLYLPAYIIMYTGIILSVN